MTVIETAPVLPGETFAGKYRVERILGRGGMGLVVAARHLELDERVAVKFLLRRDDPVAEERFAREARAAAKVKSDHVCRVYDVGRLDTGEAYLVMEYLEGRDLAERLAAEKRLPLEAVASWVIEACAALAEAHGLGIVHRDLKPANLFLAKRGEERECLKLLDFGISKSASSQELTSTTASMGTPLYMSPEQVASARDVDHRTDVWSLGVIMYELLSGKAPFAADSVVQLGVQIREAALSPLDGAPPDVAAIVTKCLAKDREARFASAAQLAAALAPFADGHAAHLARRLAPTRRGAAPVDRTAEGRPAAPIGEAPITLEPTSRASDGAERAGGGRAGWGRARVVRAAGIVVAAVVAVLVAVRGGGTGGSIAASTTAASTTTSNAASPPTPSTPTPSTPTPSTPTPSTPTPSTPTPSTTTPSTPTPSTTATVSPTPPPTLAATTTSTRRVAPAATTSASAAPQGVASAGPGTTPTTSAPPAKAEPSGPKRRSLDRSDPYAD